MNNEKSCGAVHFRACFDPIEGDGSNAKLDVTTNINNLTLFKNKIHTGMTYHALVGHDWLYISESTYNNLMGLILDK